MDNIFIDPIVINLEEFESILSGYQSGDIEITPVLQVWSNCISENFKATGFLSVSGICDRDLWVASYSSESMWKDDIEYEKAKFLELIHLSLAHSFEKITTNGGKVTVADVLIK